MAKVKVLLLNSAWKEGDFFLSRTSCNEIETLITVFTEAMYWIPDLNQFAASEYPSDDVSNTGDILFVSFLVKILEPNSAILNVVCD
jgi:hypothetical protein